MHPTLVLVLSLLATVLSLGRAIPQFVKTVRSGDTAGVSAKSWLFVSLSGMTWLPLNIHYGNFAGVVVELISIPLATVVAYRAYLGNRRTHVGDLN